jgi:hypothetical protein
MAIDFSVRVAPQLSVMGMKPNPSRGIFASTREASFTAILTYLQFADRTVLDHDDAAVFSADPKVGFRIFEETNDGAGTQAGGIVLVENGEFGTIETNEAIDRSQPQVTISGLGERYDRAPGQTIFRFPNIHRVGRFTAMHRSGPGGKCQDQQTEERMSKNAARAHVL